LFTLKLDLWTAFGYTGFWVYGLFGRRAFGYRGFWVYWLFGTQAGFGRACGVPLILKKYSIACPISIITIIGDGFCDDLPNNAACQFDGGDCCLLEVNIYFCTVCYCHTTGVAHTLAPGGKYPIGFIYL
jgi:hypothetical protein